MLYQLVGGKYLKVGNRVDMGPVGDRWGIIQKVLEEDYKLPNPCVMSGTNKFYTQPLNLFLIRGGPYNPEGHLLLPVWGFA